MGTVFRIYLKDLATTPFVDPNDPLASIGPNSASYWGEGTRYVLGLGIKKWYDAVCNPAAEPSDNGNPVPGDSMKMVPPNTKKGAPFVPVYPPSAYAAPAVKTPKRPYPATPFTESDFWWNPAASSVTGTAVLLYCVRTAADSLIVRRTPSMASKLGGTGTTHSTAQGTISEIYVEPALSVPGLIGNMQALINVAFHETMHNQLQDGNTMHNDKGLAAEKNTPGDALNATNIRRMREALARTVIQDTQYL